MSSPTVTYSFYMECVKIKCALEETLRVFSASNPGVFSSIRFEMQDTGVTRDAALKKFSLVPYFLSPCQTEAALSVPA